MTLLDMLGNPCPIPVIRARKELEKPESEGVLVLVDNFVAVQNLEKMAKGLGYAFSYETEGDARFRVSIGKNGMPAAKAESVPAAEQPVNGGLTVLITRDRMGSGSDELGRILIKGFIFSLTELSPRPTAVLFLNSGVNLAVEGSNTLADLQTLAGSGTKILACGTCLNYFNLTEKLAVGEITNMFGITNNLAASGKLITI